MKHRGSLPTAKLFLLAPLPFHLWRALRLCLVRFFTCAFAMVSFLSSFLLPPPPTVLLAHPDSAALSVAVPFPVCLSSLHHSSVLHQRDVPSSCRRVCASSTLWPTGLVLCLLLCTSPDGHLAVSVHGTILTLFATISLYFADRIPGTQDLGPRTRHGSPHRHRLIDMDSLST